MAKVCALRVLGFLLGVFFGFDGLFFRLLCVVVIGGRPVSAKGGGLGGVMPILRFRICIRHAYGC
jgi:hypothetical protein